MTSKTWVAGTVIDHAWLQDVDNSVYRATASIYPTVQRTAVDKFSDFVSLKDYGVVGDGTTDDSAAVQAALTAGNITFRTGYTYKLSVDITIPSNRTIVVERGAVVNCNGNRWTAYGVNNVEFEVNGWLKSISMALASAKSGWPNIAEGTSSVGSERGFIEFGGVAAGAAGASGFTVHGTGIISADWTGTPNISDIANQINKKGIAYWNAKNVRLEGVEVYGFEGEAVYGYGTSAACEDWVHHDLFVHDCRFNGSNFNAIGPYKGLLMSANRIARCYQNIEMSVGTSVLNIIDDPQLIGIYTGTGAGTGPINISYNTVRGGGTGAVGIYAIFNPSVVAKVFIESNNVVDCPTNAILANRLSNFSIKGNTITNWAAGAVGYPINIVNCTKGSIDGNTFISPGGFSSGSDVFYDGTSTDVTIGINYIPTNTSAAVIKYYDKGTFTPTPVNLTVVNGSGGATYAGYYWKLGDNFYKWKIVVSVTGTATTASTGGTTTFTGLPFASATPDVCYCTNQNSRNDGTGLVSATTVFPPTWAAVNAQVIITGTVIV